MAVRKDTIFEQVLAPIFRNFLIDQNALRAFYESKDWKTEADRLTNPQVDYPRYYQRQNFHGIENGYLSVEAAISYDPITQYALPPNESWVRQGLIDAIQVQPMRILDLGCGTGSMALMLKQKFPQAEVVGMDLSPYMLVVAEHRAAADNRAITLRHGQAEATGFPDGNFDLVTIGLLLHETPAAISQAILQEAYRLLRTGGEVLVLDGNQKILRQSNWLTNIFEEPYINDYANGSVEAWLGAAGFGAVQSQDIWLLNTLTRGVKGISNTVQKPLFADLEARDNGVWAAG
ncbi:methyltransferase domain-containing protein [filamentous cyanobacterium LEGE 11480]|uniref:Methyltransferase domain-containing protein n=1 Tax=Romeriopsis navalis LEGE 11480 TaxID=2777977 RepID=A0A928VKZ9_9CYAN|nr:methyltransferase domain-containing protein [Romeriopsis navalis]MBE9029663.1 methyltransferase domain-containing protein [Romeriopsis navalis LEGE 11480]